MTNLILIFSLLGAEVSDNWPGFLGAGATSLDAKTLPLKWSAGEAAWVAPLPGHGQSSPVIWGDQVFVTSVEGPNKETLHLLAINLNDGKIRWKQSLESSNPVKNSLYVSRAAPTPVTDGQSVFVFFESGDAAAFSVKGEKLWSRSLTEHYGKISSNHGLAASPLLTKNAMVVLVDNDGPSYMAALSKTNGKTLWKTNRPSRISWSSPSLASIGDAAHIISSTSGSVDGYDPETGKHLWTVDDLGGNTVATPIPFGTNSFLVGASAGRQGRNTEAAARSNIAIQIEQIEGKPKPKVLWKAEGASSSFGSPMVHAGCAYWVNRSGVIFCFDSQSGKSHYKQRLDGSCWATPLGVGDRIYFFGKSGKTTVLKAGPKFEVLAKNVLWDPNSVETDSKAGQKEPAGPRRQSAGMFSGPVQYGVAAVNGTLLIRTGDKLYCLKP